MPTLPRKSPPPCSTTVLLLLRSGPQVGERGPEWPDSSENAELLDRSDASTRGLLPPLHTDGGLLSSIASWELVKDGCVLVRALEAVREACTVRHG